MEVLTADDELQSRFLEAMEFYSQYLKELVATDTDDPEEPRSKDNQTAYLQIKKIITFLQTVSTAFTGENRTRLDEILAQLNFDYQQTIGQREAISLVLAEKEEYELKVEREKQEAEKSLREQAKRQKVYKDYMERKRKSASKKVTAQASAGTPIESVTNTDWQLAMEKAAELSAEGLFTQAVETITEPAFNESDQTLKLISLSELILLHIHRLRAITSVLTANRSSMDRFESLIAHIDSTALKKLIEQHDIPTSNTPDILKLLDNENIKIHDRKSRFAYYGDVQSFIEIIVKEKKTIDELSPAIANLLDSYQVLITLEKANIEEEASQAMTPFLSEAIDVYKADIEWLDGRPQKMKAVLDKIKEINTLIGIYGQQEAAYGSVSEPTRLSHIVEELQLNIIIYKDVIESLQSSLGKKIL
jgi:hypothetical protein